MQIFQISGYSYGEFSCLSCLVVVTRNLFIALHWSAKEQSLFMPGCGGKHGNVTFDCKQWQSISIRVLPVSRIWEFSTILIFPIIISNFTDYRFYKTIIQIIPITGIPDSTEWCCRSYRSLILPILPKDLADFTDNQYYRLYRMILPIIVFPILPNDLTNFTDLWYSRFYRTILPIFTIFDTPNSTKTFYRCYR